MPSIVPDSYDKLFCKCNGTTTSFVDSSTANTKTITANGNATQLSYKLNKSAGYFNGTTDYVVVPTSTDFNFGTGDFTIEFFVNFQTVQNCGLLKLNGANATRGNIEIYYESGNLYVYIDATNVGWNKAWTPSVNVWYHVTVRRTSGACQTYIDAVQIGTTTTDSTNTGNGGYDTKIGTSQSTYFAGWMKELRVSNISRTVAVPTAQYTADSNTKLLMHFDTPATSPLGPAIGMDGSGDYLTVASSSDWQFGTGDYSFEGYFRWGTLATTYLWSNLDCSVAWEPNIFNVNQAGTTRIVSAAFTPTANVWYYIKVARVSGTLTLTVDGRTIGTPHSGSDNVTVNTGYTIGAQVGGGNPLNGWIREFKITKAGTTVLYIKGDENNGVATFDDASVSNKTVTTVGDTKIKYTEDYRSCIFTDSETTPKYPYPVGSAKVDFFSAFGAGVGYFDGSGDYLTVPDDADFDFAAGDFTIEKYVRLSTVTQTFALCGKYSGGTGWFAQFNNQAATKLFQLNASGASEVHVNPTQIPAYIWTHLAVVRNGANIKFFVNGIQVGADQSAAATYNGAATTLRVFDDNTGGGNYLNGLSDNIRISKGIARYTDTFNPPADVPSLGGNKIVWFT